MAQQTKNAIRRAFIQLLNERPLDKISIKDIAEKGAVNRNTFYYYYADIYALVEDILQLEIEDFQSKLRRYDSWQEAFRDATAFATQNKRAVYHLYNSGNQETLRRYYHKVTLAAMTSYIRDQAEGLPADDEDIRVLSEFYAAALSGLTALWLQNGNGLFDPQFLFQHVLVRGGQLGHSDQQRVKLRRRPSISSARSSLVKSSPSRSCGIWNVVLVSIMVLVCSYIIISSLKMFRPLRRPAVPFGSSAGRGRATSS